MTNKLLVPIDLNQEASLDRVFPAAVELATARGASVDLLTVVPNLDAGIFPYVSQEFLQQTVDEAEKRLREIGKERLGDSGPTWRADAVIGPVARTIVDTAEERGADLIVMASHDPGMMDLLLGSVADQVVRRAHCSVLIVRQPKSRAA
jgi:nucleotide-binding universal stress UspA family protein